MAPTKRKTETKPSENVQTTRVTRSSTRQETPKPAAVVEPSVPTAKKAKVTFKVKPETKQEEEEPAVVVEPVPKAKKAKATPKAKPETKKEEEPAVAENGSSNKKTLVVEHCKQCNQFKIRPRRGCFEIREEGGKTFIDMKRPFAPMKALDMDAVISDIIEQVKWGNLIDTNDSDGNCFHSKRLCLFTKSISNIYENFKIIFRGKVYWIRAKEVPGWTPDLVEDSNEEDSNEEELSDDDSLEEGMKNLESENDCSNSFEVPDTVFENEGGSKKDSSVDPFGLYPLLNKKTKDQKHKESGTNSSPKFPPGFTPNNDNDDTGDKKSVNDFEEEKLNEDDGDSNNSNLKENVDESASFGRFKKSVAPSSGGSFMCLMEEVVKVGQTMGYNMDGVINNLSDIIESQGASIVDR
ncbi:hypothetical protein Tco_1316212 [Tanacetum coccineum]